MLETYTTDDEIYKTYAKTMRFTKKRNETPIEKAQLLWAKELRCNRL